MINISGPSAIRIARGFTDTIEGEIRDAVGVLQIGANVTFGFVPPVGGGTGAVEFLARDPWGESVPRRATGVLTDEHGTFRMAVRGTHEGDCDVIVRCGGEQAAVLVRVESSAIVATAPGVGTVVRGSDGRTYAFPSGHATPTPHGGGVLLLGTGRNVAPVLAGPDIVIIDI